MKNQGVFIKTTFLLLPTAVIALSFFIIRVVSDFDYNAEDTAFYEYILFRLGSVICFILSTFYIGKSCLSYEMDKKLQNIEKSLAFLFASVVLFVCIMYFLLIEEYIIWMDCLLFGWIPPLQITLLLSIFKMQKEACYKRNEK